MNHPRFRQYFSGLLGRRTFLMSLLLAGLLQSTFSAQADSEIKFPWRNGATWYMTQGIHEIRDFDFAPGGGGSKNDEVLAVGSGTAKLRCGPDAIGQVAVSLITSAGTFEYWHLQGSAVLGAGITSGGVSVSQGQVIGRLYPSAGSFNGACGIGSASHLHLRMPYLPITIQGTVFSGSSPAVMTRLTSTNGGVPTPTSPNMVSPGDANFTKGGADSGWTPVINGGNSGRAIYTYVNNTGRDNWARWTFDLGTIGGSGTYKIEAYIPSRNAGTTNARYQINTMSGVQVASVNQRAVSGWLTLGNFTLAQGSAWIELDDNTGEPFVIDENHNIAFDSIRVSFVAPVQYTVSATAGSNGTITPNGNSTVTSGGSVTYTITPSAGYHIASLTVDGQAVAVANKYSFNSVSGNHSLSATFAPDLISTVTSLVLPSRGTSTAKVALSGKVTPTVNAGKVQLVWKYKINGKYVDVETTSVNVSQGKFSVSKMLKQKGAWQVTAQYLGSGVAPVYQASKPVADVIVIN